MNYSDSSYDQCHTDWWRTTAIHLGFAVYCVLPPIYFAVGLFGNTALILTCLRKNDKENPYLYQVLIASSRGLFIVSYVLVLIVAGGFVDGAWHVPDWWSECYACVWITAKFGYTLFDLPAAIEPILTVAMLFDRFRALKNPIAYRTPTKRQYAAVYVGGTLVGLGFAAVTFARFYVVPGPREGTYVFEFDMGWLFVLYSHLRDALMVILLIGTYALNSAVCYLYFKRIRKVKVVLSTQQERKKRAAAKDLLIVSITQSAFDGFLQSVNVLFYMYFNTASGPCYHIYERVIVQLTDLGTCLATIGQFYILCAISRRFRNDAVKLFRRSAVVAPT